MLADSIKRLERLARGHYRGAMRMGPAAAGPIVIRKKSSSRSVEKIRSWRPATGIRGTVDITIKPRILRELCPTSKSRVAPRDTPWRPLSLSKFRHNGHTSTPSKEFFFVAYASTRTRGSSRCLYTGCFRFFGRDGSRIVRGSFDADLKPVLWRSFGSWV